MKFTDDEQRSDANTAINAKLWATCQAEAKRKFKIHPSAYSNGYASKIYKERGGKWRSDSLKTWFAEDWKAINSSGKIVGGCGDGETQGKVKCLPASKARSLSKKDRSTLAKRKQAKDPRPSRSGSPVMVSSKLDAMDPTVLARAIASIEQKYGLRIDAWQPIGKNNMGAKCNEDFGWVGLRGACKRLKKTSDRTRLIQESKQSLVAKIRRQKGFKAIGGAELAKESASLNEPFKRIDGLSSLEEWDADIEEARKHTNYSILKGKEGRFQALEKTVSAIPDQSEWAAEIASNRKTIKSRMAGLSKGIDTSLDSAVLSDNVAIVDTIKKFRGSGEYLSGGVSKGGKLQAAFLYKMKRDHVSLEYLAANPASLLKKGGAKGSGTAAIKDIIERSLESGFKGRIKLTALDGAVGFYKKLGFISKGENFFELSASAAKRILKGKS